jgi:predicted PurR-regulated permease PerM
MRVYLSRPDITEKEIEAVCAVLRTPNLSLGSKLPFIVMFIGVFGGIATFGFIGVFLGPTLLAVGYSLAQEILSHRRYVPARESTSKPQ